MSGRPTLAELLRGLVAVMSEHNLQWYLFGAQAAIVWGSPRLSGDVDLTVKIEPSDTDAFIRSMNRRGFDMAASDPELVEETRVLPFVHRGTGMPIDVVMAGPGLEDEFLARAMFVDVQGVSIPVITPEDLIITKILAGRPKDIEDVRGVIHERRASLDVERIRGILGLLEQALAQSDLRPVFEKAWREAEG